MAKTKRLYILATCFLSGAAAIISFVSLGTQGWVTSNAALQDESSDNTIKFGLFSGVFKQTVNTATYDLSMVCKYDLNVCALLCGSNVGDILEKVYNHEEDNQTKQDATCDLSSVQTRILLRAENNTDNGGDENTEERIFINAGVWLCTVIFLVLSAVVGLFASGLAVWNTAANPIQVYFSVFGLYIYNGIAFCSLSLSVILWGAMYAKNLTKNIPCNKTFLEGFTTDGLSKLGYSYWILVASLCLYLASVFLLYFRHYLISREPKVNIQLEDNEDPVIYLY